MRVIYAFSGDSITYGHINIVERAAKVFDEIIVGIGVNPEKKYLFSLNERTAMARKALGSISNATVVSFEGLLVDYAYEHAISVIIRGVRDAKDYDFEKLLRQVGGSQKLGIETILLPARRELDHVSSSAVKEVQKNQGLTYEYVPLHVKQALEERISGQYILGVTGESGTGKSYICNKFETFGAQTGIIVHNIELDHVGHSILENLAEPSYQKTREDIASVFGSRVVLPGGKINRKVLGELVFGDKQKLEQLNSIMHTPILVRLRRELFGKQGLLLLNAALFTESDMTYLCNNNMLLVTTDDPSQQRRLRARGLTPEQMKRRLESQYTTAQKQSWIEQKIREQRNGTLWTVQNNDSTTDTTLRTTFNAIVQKLGVKH